MKIMSILRKKVTKSLGFSESNYRSINIFLIFHYSYFIRLCLTEIFNESHDKNFSLLQKAEIKRFTTLRKHKEPPKQCDPEKMNLWDVIVTHFDGETRVDQIISSVFVRYSVNYDRIFTLCIQVEISVTSTTRQWSSNPSTQSLRSMYYPRYSIDSFSNYYLESDLESEDS